MKRKISSVIAVLLLWSGFSTYAQDVYPGAMGLTNVEDPQPSIVFGALNNPSETEWLRVTLPVTRSDYLSNTLRGWVKVVDTSDEYNFFAYMCSVLRTDTGEYYVWSTEHSFSTGSGKETQTLEFSAQGGYPFSYTFIYCGVPPTEKTGVVNQPKIVSYSIIEE